jgi:signal transduction histidine kinase
MEATRLKILAIDDNADNLTTLKAIVQDVLPRCTLSTALDGRRGIELAGIEDPDVILLDIVMPGMDGYEVCRQLKSNEKLRTIPVVFLTALRTDRESRIKALDAGADAFLSKPLDDQELVAAVRAMARIKVATLIQQGETKKLTRLVEERTKALTQSRMAILNSVADLKIEMAEHAKSEERYRQLAQRVETIREEERKRLARELHDDIGQTFTALKIDLVMLESECTCHDEVKSKMNDMQKLLGEGIQSVHSLCRRLRPGAIDDLGLTGALTGLVESWKQRNQVECVFCADMNESAVPDDIKTAVFRMVQEALTNVSRYANASKVEINLVADGRLLSISVADNGCGMKAGAKNKPTSFGLLGMQERIEAFGGELRIKSAPGEGTHIEAAIPLSGGGALKEKFSDPLNF